MIGKTTVRMFSIAVILFLGFVDLGYSSQAALELPELSTEIPDSEEAELAAGAAYMVKDINPSGGIIYSYPSPLYKIEFNGQFIFAAMDGTHGEELWKSDGTADGTEMIKDIYTGETGSQPGDFVPFNNALYLRATSDEHDSELWRTDGTTAGTVLIKDIHPDYGSYPNYLTEFDGYLYFSATDAEHGEELWRSDGTGSGTELFKNINLTGDSMPAWITPFGDHFYFFADDGVNGIELWKSDGTAAGTQMVKNRDVSGWKMDNLTVYENALYFITYEDYLHDGLWVSDGTETGTEKLMDIGVPDDPGMWRGNAWLQSAGDFLFFCNLTESDGYEYWISDGTASGTDILKDIYPGANSGCYWYISNPGIALHDGEYFLSGLDELHSREFWKSDGTESGTNMVKDINPSGVGVAEGFYSGEYISLNQLIFSADDGTTGDELWKTDGTDSGTALLQNIASGSNPSEPKGMTLVGEKLFFFANDHVHDYELWVLPLKSMSEVILSGEIEGEMGVEYSFDADVSPGDALTPLTYTWTATGQDEVTHYGPLNDTVSFTWDAAGTKTISIMVSGIVNSVTDEMTIDISGPQVPVGSLTLTGDSEGDLGIAYSFTAILSPSDATTPITYEWQATGHPPQVNLGGLSDTADFTWSSPGLKTVAVTANNGVNELNEQVEIEISAKLTEIYIPVVISK